jgi:hypothetical protein
MITVSPQDPFKDIIQTPCEKKKQKKNVLDNIRRRRTQESIQVSLSFFLSGPSALFSAFFFFGGGGRYFQDIDDDERRRRT